MSIADEVFNDDAAAPEDGTLTDVLTRLAGLYAEHDKASAAEKEISRRIKECEALACELLAASGMERVGVAGKTWWFEADVQVSVRKDARDEVIKAAEQEGIPKEDITTVATATLKSWLKERAKRLGLPESGSFTEGTAFAGLVSENPIFVLRKRTR